MQTNRAYLYRFPREESFYVWGNYGVRFSKLTVRFKDNQQTQKTVLSHQLYIHNMQSVTLVHFSVIQEKKNTKRNIDVWFAATIEQFSTF